MALSEQQLEKLIDYANDQVRTLVADYNVETFENDKDLQRMYLAISNMYEELNVTLSDVLPPAIYESYISGVTKAEQLLEVAGLGAIALGSKGVQDLVKAPVHLEAISAIISDTLDDLAAAVRTAEKYSIRELDKAFKEVQQELANGMIAGFTTKQMTKRVGEKFGNIGMTSFVTSDGKHLPLDFYAKTVTRTKMQTAYNHGHLNRYKERDVKHVVVSGNIPTCAECSVYRGIVFATERGDDFPYINLHKTFPAHPNCRCNFRPWIKKFKSDEDVGNALAKAKDFDPERDTRSKSEARKYDANQRAKQQARQKRLTFNKMQARLGKDGPQSFKEFKNASKREYHNWVAQMKNMYKRKDDVIIKSEISKQRNNAIDMTSNEKTKLINYAKEVWEPKLEEEEINSLLDYTGNEYENINDYLMGKINPSDQSFKKEIENNIKHIRSAIDKFNYDGFVIAYRGVSSGEFNFIKENTKLFSFVDFKSTSIHEVIAKEFAKKDENNKPYILKFIIPSNAKGAYIDNVSSIPGEFEYLLSDNQTYTATEVEHTEYNMIVIEVLGYE